MKLLPVIALLLMVGGFLAFNSGRQVESGSVTAPTPSPTPPAKGTPYVFAANEGEPLLNGRAGHIKVSPQTGSKYLAVVTQPLPTGKRINVHMHEHDEEVFFVHKGKGTVVLNDEKKSVDEGSVVYIPAGTWHGFEAGNDMQLVWIISPPHYADLHRLFFKPGFNPTKEEGDALMRKYGYREKPSSQ